MLAFETAPINALRALIVVVVVHTSRDSSVSSYSIVVVVASFAVIALSKWDAHFRLRCLACSWKHGLAGLLSRLGLSTRPFLVESRPIQPPDMLNRACDA